MSRHWRRLAYLALTLAALVQPLVAPGTAIAQPLSTGEIEAILRHGPWPAATVPDRGNALSGQSQAIELGRRLFFDPRLSANGSVACVSCHLPKLAFSDGRARSVGLAELDRNAPGLLDAAQQRWFGWDGASDSLWSQAIRPLLDPREMGSDPQRLAAAISADAELSCRYRSLFKVSPQEDEPQRLLVRTAKSIGAFVATLRSGRTEFDRFRDALARQRSDAVRRYPPDALRGLRLFVGPAGCPACHTGANFSNGEFADIGVPFFIRPGVVDPGRHGGIRALQASPFNLLGPHADALRPGDDMPTRHVDLQHRNFGEFKVPGLRNLVWTAPYMHDGRLGTLEAVVEHYSGFNPERVHADGQAILRPLNLTAREKADLVAFLRTLSAPDAARWRAAPEGPPCVGSALPGSALAARPPP